MRKTLTSGALFAALALCGAMSAASAQDSRSSAAPVMAPADASPPASRPARRRAAPKAAAPSCDKVSDPWGNLCEIRKKAEVACSDVATPAPAKARTARKARKSTTPEAPARNQRQECVDAYMRNV